MRAGSIRRFACLPRSIRGKGRATRMARDVEALLASAQAAVRAAAAELPSAADLRVEAARAETLAASGAGAVAKTAGMCGRPTRSESQSAGESDSQTRGTDYAIVLHFRNS